MINALYELIYILPLTLASVLVAGPYLGMPENSVSGSILACFVSAWLVSMRHIGKKNRILCLGGLVIFTLGIFFIIGGEKRNIIFTEYSWLGIAAGFSIPAIILGRILEKWQAVRIVFAILTVAALPVCLYTKFDLGKMSVAIVLFLLLVIAMEEIQRAWIKSGYKDVKGHMVLGSPIIILICILVFMIPASEKPYNWTAVKNIYNTISLNLKQFTGSLTHREEEYSGVGFSENSTLFGKIGENDKEVLRVTVDRDSITGLYLQGSISDTFENMDWSYGPNHVSDERMFDALETTAAVRKYDDDNYYNYIVKSTLRIENLLFNTRFAFGQAKPRLEPAKTENPSMKDAGGSILFDKRLKYTDTYTIASYIFNYSNPNISAFLSSGQAIAEQEWNRMLRNDDLTSYPGYSYENYLKYKESIYKNYTKKAGSTERVQAVLDKIRDNSDGQYDELKNLEALLGSYSYTTEGRLPDYVTDGESFTDYMLFESREGYCVHFATAFVLLARELGYPARYVQGYFVERKREMVVDVCQSNAHAWPEVYFENIGWIAFEPTPGSYGQRGWKINTISAQLANRQEYDPSVFLQGQNIPAVEEEEEVTEEDHTIEKLILLLKIILLPLMGVAVFITAYLLISHVVTKKKYAALPDRDKLVWNFKDSLRILKKMGYALEEGETLFEYKLRLFNNISDAKLNFISYYEEYVYSNKLPKGEYVQEIEKENRILKDILRQKKRKLGLKTRR